MGLKALAQNPGSVVITGGIIDGVTIGGTTAVQIQGYMPTNYQTGTSYTAVLGDSGKLISMTNGSASTFTIPPNSSVAFVAETEIAVWQNGAGQVTNTPGSGVTFVSYTSLTKNAGQYAMVSLKQTSTINTWRLFGNLG